MDGEKHKDVDRVVLFCRMRRGLEGRQAPVGKNDVALLLNHVKNMTEWMAVSFAEPAVNGENQLYSTILSGEAKSEASLVFRWYCHTSNQ